jgi:hypothetical protein
MRITESSLRRVIRRVISENLPYDESDEYTGYGAYGEVEVSNVSLEELEEMLMIHSFNPVRVDGFRDAWKAKSKYAEGEITREAYLEELRPVINAVIERDGRSNF